MLTFKLNTNRQTFNKQFATTEKSPIFQSTNYITRSTFGATNSKNNHLKKYIIMKFRILIISILFLGFYSCNNDCTDNIVNITSLEKEYGCTDTKYQMDIDLSENYMIIRNQPDFAEFVSGSCQPTIDFSTYDLVIGKKGLGSGNESIEYQLIENCETGNLNLKVTFFQNIASVAPNLTYHALIPKMESQQELNTEIIIEY